MKRRFARLRALEYRHYIGVAITLVFLGCGFLFPNALPRLGEAFRDLGTSVAFYVMELAEGENPITATVNGMPAWEWAPSRYPPLRLIPWTWEEFKAACGKFGAAFFSAENLRAWWWSLSDVLYYISRGMLIVMPFVLVLFLYAKRYTSETNNDNNRDSLPLALWRRFTFCIVYPVRDWLRELIAFFRENNKYLKLWLFLWVIYFRVAVILVEFIAFYLYAVSSFDLLSIYTQLVKLLHDLAPMVRFLPIAVWIGVILYMEDRRCKAIAYEELYRREAKNDKFVQERGVVTIIYGPMGVGKTSLLTSLSLTAEVQMRNDAYEILEERDMMFPAFPWCNLRAEIAYQTECGRIVDTDSCKRFVREWERSYKFFAEDPARGRWLARAHRKGRFRWSNFAFDYDIAHYPMTYESELGTVTLWDAIEDYTCAYFIFSIETSLIISNYSIRTDEIKVDLGNMPLWDSDFFRRKASEMEDYSRYAHIIDFDMLRLGKRMLDNNPNRNAFGFGVYVVSEIDKERKNALELRETKKNTDECNQMNDLFNACLKMSRHACVIANRVFLKIFCDLQRPEDWGAGGREVGEIVYIAEKGDMHPTLPFFSTYWWTSVLYGWARRRFDRFYQKYIHVRSDNTLFVHLLKSVMARLGKHYKNTEDLFGCQTLHLECESGRMDGEATKTKFYRMPKKDYSRRYSTNCLSAIFEGDVPNRVSINDFVTYAGIMATAEELALQNSHFQCDLEKRKQKYAS